MLVSAFIKGLFLYFLFITLRGLWRSYKTVEAIRGAAQGRPQDSTFKKQHSASRGDTFEADYHVIGEND